LVLGMYLVVNLRLTTLDFPSMGLRGGESASHAGFPAVVYWTTYVFIFLLPCLSLFYGLLRRERSFVVAGLITGILTLVTNKPYLGMTRYVWDPAILGVLLVGVSMGVIHWFSKGKNKIRLGYTSENLLKPENHGIDLAAAGIAMMGPAAAQESQGFSGQGGESGGAGAGRGV